MSRPFPMKWGFLGLLIFMTGNGVESNFLTPYMVNVLGSAEATVAAIISAYSVAVLVGSYLAGALSDLIGPRRAMLMGFATELGKKAWDNPAGEAHKAQIPLRRFAEPSDVAAAAVFLASGGADMVNGADLLVDGGYTIR